VLGLRQIGLEIVLHFFFGVGFCFRAANAAACTDTPSTWMASNGFTCDNYADVQSCKTCTWNAWISNEWCKQSCFNACDESDNYPFDCTTPAPTSSPTSSPTPPTPNPTDTPTTIPPTAIPTQNPTSHPTSPTSAPTDTPTRPPYTPGDRIVTLVWPGGSVDVMSTVTCSNKYKQLEDDIGVPNDQLSAIQNLATGCYVVAFRVSRNCPNGVTGDKYLYTEDTDFVVPGVSGITVACGATPPSPIVTFGWGGGQVSVFHELRCMGGYRQSEIIVGVPNDKMNSVTILDSTCSVEVFKASRDCPDGLPGEKETYSSSTTTVMEGISGIAILCVKANRIATLHWFATSIDVYSEVTCTSMVNQIENDLGVPNDELTHVTNLKSGCQYTIFAHSQDCPSPDNGFTFTSDRYNLRTLMRVSGITISCP